MCRLDGREKSLYCWLCVRISGAGSAFGTGEGEWVRVLEQVRPLSTWITGFMSSVDDGIPDKGLPSTGEPRKEADHLLENISVMFVFKSFTCCKKRFVLCKFKSTLNAASAPRILYQSTKENWFLLGFSWLYHIKVTISVAYVKNQYHVSTKTSLLQKIFILTKKPQRQVMKREISTDHIKKFSVNIYAGIISCLVPKPQGTKMVLPISRTWDGINIAPWLF